MSGLVYDAGALIAAESGDRRVWAIHKRALERGIMPVVPAGVIVEAWRGGPAAGLSRLLAGTSTEELNEEAARASGELLGLAGGTVEAVDATVAELALRRGDAVLTSNATHIQQLAGAVGRRLDVIPC